MPTTSASAEGALRVDLSRPDNAELVRGRSKLVEALWIFLAAPILSSHVVVFSSLRVFLLRLFGAEIGTNVYLKPGIRVKFPWYLSIGDHCWIGEDVWIDNLAKVSIAPHVCVSQGVYLCTGNHDWSVSNMRLFTRPITLETGSWVGARSVVCPGVTVGEGAILSVGSVASKNLEPWGVYTGNPAARIRTRVLKG